MGREFVLIEPTSAQINCCSKGTIYNFRDVWIEENERKRNDMFDLDLNQG